jgi:hypothetical protein
MSTAAGTFDQSSSGGIVPRTATSAGTASADFGNTMVLSSLAVFDSQMNRLSNVTFSSASGVVYGDSGVVPEPGTLVIVISAVFVLALRHRDRTR